MIDWSALEELYTASRSENERVRSAARNAIGAGIDEWVKEYIGPLTEKGPPRFDSYEELADRTLCWLDRDYEETDQEYAAREKALRADKLGILLVSHKWHEAKKSIRTYFDVMTLFGHDWNLSISWGDHPEHDKLYARYLARKQARKTAQPV